MNLFLRTGAITPLLNEKAEYKAARYGIIVVKELCHNAQIQGILWRLEQRSCHPELILRRKDPNSGQSQNKHPQCAEFNTLKGDVRIIQEL